MKRKKLKKILIIVLISAIAIILAFVSQHKFFTGPFAKVKCISISDISIGGVTFVFNCRVSAKNYMTAFVSDPKGAEWQNGIDYEYDSKFMRLKYLLGLPDTYKVKVNSSNCGFWNLNKENAKIGVAEGAEYKLKTGDKLNLITLKEPFDNGIRVVEKLNLELIDLNREFKGN